MLAVAFSPNGRTLVTGGLDQKALVWDVSQITGRPRVMAERSAAELEADWKDLGGDGVKGYVALGRFVSSPKSGAPYLAKRLQAAAEADTKPIEGLIEKLDDGEFQVRERATKELVAMGDRAAPLLRKAIDVTRSSEARQRLGGLLDRIEVTTLSAETVREVRAMEALEAIGTPEARRLLDRLAAGSPWMRLTHEAKASGVRLAKRP